MIGRDEVVSAYRLLLGREPENEDVVKGWMQAENLETLRQEFMSGKEFRSKLELGQFHANVVRVGRHLYGPGMKLDLDILPAQRDQMLAEVAATWGQFGETEPHWSVVTDEKFKQEHIQESEDEFYATAVLELRMIRTYFERNGEDIGAIKTVLELGCGVGRVTSQLAAAFPEVIGADVSAAHLAIAQRYFEKKGLGNARFVRLAHVDDVEKLPGFDLFYSAIALQHSPPPIIDALLERVMAKANPGGYLLFQIPTYREGYAFNFADYSKNTHRDMEMHLLPQRRVYELMRKYNFNLIEVQEDNMPNDTAFASHTFFARRTL
ncbi:class I SAM-dependent methyltransferase [Microvirga flavescens]|uniref:class I SAM-dependent methyltransferase n=1 Tax=Microvirga flavescens TaxID=2249811 RepID=UPI000DD84849|nr:class I SAM-dependent methyltransferase [Microvirga flavescens]